MEGRGKWVMGRGGGMWRPEMEVWGPAVAVGGGWGLLGGDLVVGWASWRMDGVKDDFVGYGKMMGCDGKMMGCGDRDLNRSHERWLPRGRTIAQCWANVHPQVSMHVWPGDERSSTGAWRGGERSPSAGRTFTSSVFTALLRGLL
jgi:hypothetical protein